MSFPVGAGLALCVKGLSAGADLSEHVALGYVTVCLSEKEFVNLNSGTTTTTKVEPRVRSAAVDAGDETNRP